MIRLPNGRLRRAEPNLRVIDESAEDYLYPVVSGRVVHLRWMFPRLLRSRFSKPVESPWRRNVSPGPLGGYRGQREPARRVSLAKSGFTPA